MKKLIWFLTKLIILVYIGLNIIFYYKQDKFIFYPKKIEKAVAEEFSKDKMVDLISFKADDGTVLNGWLVNPKNKKIIIYYGGNSEELSYNIEHFKKIDDYAVLLINYRGYGLNEGIPSEKSFIDDARTIYNQVRLKYDNIVLFGRSLGTGIAVRLAKEKKPDALILTSPYNDLGSVIQGYFPILPVKLLLNHRFSSLKYAKQTDIKMLALLAENDEIIDRAYSSALINGWYGNKERIIVKNSNHNSIIDKEEYLDHINKYLSKL